MTSSCQLVFRGKIHPALRAFVLLLVPLHLMASVSPLVVMAAISPAPPQGFLQPPASAFAQQHPSAAPKPPVIPRFDPPVSHPVFSADPTDRELITARCFEDPLLPLAGDPQPGENADLARALTAFRQNPRDFSPLTAFLDHHPDSRWKASLLANLGLIYRNQGYWSRALAAFDQAWSLGKNADSSLLKASIDRAFGELVELHARLGHVEQLETLFEEAKGRDIQGAGTERVAGARAGLWLMKNDPGEAFRCGPLAVSRIFELLHPGRDVPKVVSDCHSTRQGTDFATLQSLAQKIGLDYQVAFRSPGAPVIVPSVVNWKVGHFAALSRELDGRGYLSQDPTFGLDILVSPAVLDAEASGYFLVPSGPLPSGWRPVPADEAKTIFGKGNAGPASPAPPPAAAVTVHPLCHIGMAGYDLEEASICLMLMDTPVGYAPPIGPAVYFTANYNHRESASMTSISNLGNKWSFDWLSYIQVSSGATTVVYGPGGGQLPYTGYNSGTGYFAAQQLNQDLLHQDSSSSYTLYHPDGSKDVYNQSDGGSTPRIFRTSSVDAQGHTITYTYDSGYRLYLVTDPLGQPTSITYKSNTPTSSDYYHIAMVTDPFNRSATFEYTGDQLTSITDVLGLTSTFAYGTGDFITSLTTPYGTTTFAGSDTISGGSDYDRWLLVTDPVGAQERIEWKRDSSAFMSYGDPTATVPANFTNEYIDHRNTFYWDKKAMATAPGDYSKARITHWQHYTASDSTIGSTIIESTKEPLENRVWRAYPDQANGTMFPGTGNQPSEVARILDDGTEQDFKYAYNDTGNVTQVIDPLGRETDYVYATNNIDLLTIKQKNGSSYDVLAQFTYDTAHTPPQPPHLPLTAIDASGQTTTYTYNSAGQVSTITNAKSEVTKFYYDPAGAANTTDLTATGYLVSVVGPVTGAIKTYSYDDHGRVHTVTDSEGYITTMAYDAFDRPTTITYPDGTYNQFLYKYLDAEWIRDRRGRWTHQYHDAVRHLTQSIDPLYRTTTYDWCNCGALEGITDPAGHTTTWMRDAQSRITQKIYPDATVESYAYESTTSRLKSVTDAKSQRTNYTYYLDNTLHQVTYTDTSGAALSPATPSVTYTYDTVYPRPATMVDGVGTTNYTYNPVPTSGTTTGANRLATIDGPFTGTSDTITYTYDELGRVTGTSINDSGSPNASTVMYDALGRVTSATNPLGTFTYGYVNQTGRPDHIVYPNSQRTNYSYYSNSATPAGNDDQRLSQIQNLVASGGANISTFGYTYDADGIISTWSKQIDTASALTSSFAYDAADQLIAASVPSSSSTTNYSYGYDLAGNRTREQIDPGVTTSAFNNVNQLTGQSPGGPMQFTGTVNEPSTVTLAGHAASVDGSGNWRGTANVTAGTSNSIALVATDVNGNVTNKTITITPSSGSSHTLSYDLDGAMTNNGSGQTYTYDAANRLSTITIGSNVTTFVYDGEGRRVQEKLNGTVIKQWVWCPGDAQPCEERDASNAVTKRFYALGEQIGSTSYYFTKDHLGSVREVTNSSGVVQARYDYDPYGRRTLVSGTDLADFGFTGDYYHAASGLNLTLYRAYDANLGRWLSRDPIGEDGGLNLYRYVANSPISLIDPLGLFLGTSLTAGEFFGTAWTGAWQGAAAFADGANPFGNPFASHGAYNPCDKSLQWSRHIGTATAIIEGALGLGAAAFYAPGTSIFFSGGQGAAETYATQLAGSGAASTIYDTVGGGLLQSLGVTNNTVWSVASWFYANTAGASAIAILGAGGGTAATAFGSVELPVLVARATQLIFLHI